MAARAPRWVNAFGIVAGVLFLLFIILHLTGVGPGDHTHLGITEHGAHQP
jgi:hypothetical protein